MHWLLFLIATMGWEEMMRRQPAAERPTDQVSRSAPPVERPSAPEPRPRPETSEASEVSPPHTRTEPEPPRAKPPAQQATAPPPQAAQPNVYQLTDSSGQIWTHSNADWLRQWVAQRNQALATQATPKASLPPWFSQTFGGCPPGGCTR